MKNFTLAKIGVLGVALSLSQPVSRAQNVKTAMPVAEQNALVQKYCAVCHDDAHRNGGLSLQHFDASTVEPSLAAMMVSKLKTGAIGAAGIPQPDRATQDALLSALSAKSVGAQEWRLMRTQDPATRTPLLTASVLRQAPSSEELYRLQLTCRPDIREGEMQLTWSPNAADTTRVMSVAVDTNKVLTYTVGGLEKMGNGSRKPDGTEITSGSAAVILYATHAKSGAATLSMPLPTGTLTINNVFLGETVVFPFDQLTSAMRKELSLCFGEAR
jgi:hypothetical protein